MADDFDYDDGGVFEDMDGWLYVEDDYDLADELAEGQIAEPGYSGTNHEIAMQEYEFDLYGYWEDLEYADDAYWDYDLSKSAETSQGKKRKHDGTKKKAPDKRQKTTAKGRLSQAEYDRDQEPVLFHDLEDRYQKWRQEPPLLKDKTVFSLLPDWKTRCADQNVGFAKTAMPAEMKEAAEAEEEMRLEDPEEGEGEWVDEDEDDGNEEAEGGLGIDPEMLKVILKEKLGAQGLGDMDEDQFMQAIQKIMSGEGGDDAANELTDAVLGKVNSDTGDTALTDWLAGQGVNLEDDDASSVASGPMASGIVDMQNSPVDSAISIAGSSQPNKKTTSISMHASSPNSSKKRVAPASNDENARPTKTKKIVKFDVPSSSSPSQTRSEAQVTSDDPLMPEVTITDLNKEANMVATETNTALSAASSSRKRKVGTVEKSENNPLQERKRARKTELHDLGPLPEAHSSTSPAKRTRSARAKSGK